MSLRSTAGPTLDFTPAPAGTTIGRCIRIIDLGKQPLNAWGKHNPEVAIYWELPSDLDAQGDPFVVWEIYNNCIHEKANLGKLLISWRGKPFTEEQRAGFELADILGIACQISIVHNTKSTGGVSRTYANVDNVFGLIKGMQTPDQVWPSVLYDIDSHDQEVYDSLPEFIQKKIDQSEERTGTPQEIEAVNNDLAAGGPPDDDPPF